MNRTYLVGHMKEGEFIPCEVSTDMSEPQIHGVYVNIEKRFVIEVAGIFEPNMVITTDLEDAQEVEALTHLRDSLKEKVDNG